MIDCYSILTVDGWREPAGRDQHRTAVVNNQLYLWGGDQREMPKVHDSAKKRQFFSSVEVFDVNTGCWEQHTTSGTPPLRGVLGFACVAVRNDLHYFGGYCGHGDCYHNSVHTLSTSTLQWRMLAPSTTEGGAPMKKTLCGMVHFTDGEEDLLYVVGGVGHAIPSSRQHGAQYHQSLYGVFTDEQHIFSLSTSECDTVCFSIILVNITFSEFLSYQKISSKSAFTVIDMQGVPALEILDPKPIFQFAPLPTTHYRLFCIIIMIILFIINA